LFQQARSGHRKGVGLADLRSALEGNTDPVADARCSVGTDRVQRAVGNPQAVREDPRRGGPVLADLNADCRLIY
jgi:hypothetical protein